MLIGREKVGGDHKIIPRRLLQEWDVINGVIRLTSHLTEKDYGFRSTID
jgi:hypothetical protein